MKHEYTARKIKSPGRSFFSVAFRHPRRMNRGKPGKQICKGLGTDSETEADGLVGDLKKLLETPEISEQEAARLGIDPRIIEIFYDRIEAGATHHRELRNEML